MENRSDLAKDKGLVGNETIEAGIEELKKSFTEENLAVVLTQIRARIKENGQFVVAVDVGGVMGENKNNSFTLKTASYNGKKWFVAYTSFEEELKGSHNVMSGFLADIGQLMNMALKSDEVEGIILNPYGNMMSINKAVIAAIVR